MNLNFNETLNNIELIKLNEYWNIYNPQNKLIDQKFLDKHLDDILDILMNEKNNNIKNKIASLYYKNSNELEISLNDLINAISKVMNLNSFALVDKNKNNDINKYWNKYNPSNRFVDINFLEEHLDNIIDIIT